MAVGAIAGTLGAIVLFEGVQSLLEHIVGDPEAEVQTALQQLARRTQRRALGIEAVEQLGAEDVEERFSRFNEIPRRVLTEAALARNPQPPLGGSSGGSEVLDMVSARLGVSPEQLSSVSHPSRLGDMSGIAHRLGKSPTR